MCDRGSGDARHESDVAVRIVVGRGSEDSGGGRHLFQDFRLSLLVAER